MTPSCFLRINTVDQNCYWTLSGKVPQIQPDNHVLILMILAIFPGKNTILKSLCTMLVCFWQPANSEKEHMAML